MQRLRKRPLPSGHDVTPVWRNFLELRQLKPLTAARRCVGSKSHPRRYVFPLPSSGRGHFFGFALEASGFDHWHGVFGRTSLGAAGLQLRGGELPVLQRT